VLRLPAVDASKTGAYSVVVSNGVGSVTSQMPDATLAVSTAAPAATGPSIVASPVSVTVISGNTANFAVGVSGTGPFSYQWLKNGQPISGATGASFSLAPVSSADAGSYTVQVNNSVGPVAISSPAATLTVNPGAVPIPLSVTDPTPQVQTPGGSATFAVAASGTGPITYQWLKDGVTLPGATLPVLTVNGINSADAGTYSVTVSNGVDAPITKSASLLVLGVPVINTQPVAASVTAGSTATFSVAATGTQLRYLWLLNGVVVPGATDASYTTPALTAVDSGAVYSVVVYNGAGASVSSLVVLTVTAPVTTLAYEGFNYPLGDLVQGKNGGTGWASAWVLADKQGIVLSPSISGVITSGLGYTDSNGKALLTSPGAWQTDTAVGYGQLLRATTQSVGAPNTTAWLSFLVQQDPVGPALGLEVLAGGTLGTDYPGGPQNGGIWGGVGANRVQGNYPVEPQLATMFGALTGGATAIPGWAPGSVAFVLMRSDFGPTGRGGLASLWINPPLDPGIPLPTADRSGVVAGFANAVYGVTLLWGPNRNFVFDEVRLASTRAGATPFVTAP
jgi:hypothetical protein